MPAGLLNAVLASYALAVSPANAFDIESVLPSLRAMPDARTAERHADGNSEATRARVHSHFMADETSRQCCDELRHCRSLVMLHVHSSQLFDINEVTPKFSAKRSTEVTPALRSLK
jgi:hypothetical protein